MPETRTTSSTGGQKGTKLARFDLIPPGPLRELAEHYGRGARKYADNQWRRGYEWSKSFAAKQRHDWLFWQGFDYDVCSNDPDGCSFVDAEGGEYVPDEPDTCFNHTGSHHLAASAWHAFLLLEFKDSHPEHDDRYKPDCCASHDDLDDEIKFSGRVWVGPALALPEDGWEEVGYTTIDPSPILYSDQASEAISGDDLFQTVPSSFGTHDYPAHVDISIADVDHDLLRMLFGRPVLTRFVCGIDGIEDLENPLPYDVDDIADLPLEPVIVDDDEVGYLSEYRDMLKKHAPKP